MAVRLLGTGRREEGRCDGGAAYDTRARAGALSASTIRRGRGRAGPGPGGRGRRGRPARSVARYSFDGSEFSTERAVMLGDFYVKDVWRFA
ncbi:hypothetical protein ABZ731_18215, partial [Streptomyces albidoflavus]